MDYLYEEIEQEMYMLNHLDLVNDLTLKYSPKFVGLILPIEFANLTI